MLAIKYLNFTLLAFCIVVVIVAKLKITAKHTLAINKKYAPIYPSIIPLSI